MQVPYCVALPYVTLPFLHPHHVFHSSRDREGRKALESEKHVALERPVLYTF
jgi:hypothetical protein